MIINERERISSRMSLNIFENEISDDIGENEWPNIHRWWYLKSVAEGKRQACTLVVSCPIRRHQMSTTPTKRKDKTLMIA